MLNVVITIHVLYHIPVYYCKTQHKPCTYSAATFEQSFVLAVGMEFNAKVALPESFYPKLHLVMGKFSFSLFFSFTLNTSFVLESGWKHTDQI